jgi:hypothetical protein
MERERRRRVQSERGEDEKQREGER